MMYKLHKASEFLLLVAAIVSMITMVLGAQNLTWMLIGTVIVLLLVVAYSFIKVRRTEFEEDEHKSNSI